MPGFEPGTSCTEDMRANHYTIPSSLKRCVEFRNKFYISNFYEFYGLNFYCGKSSDNIYWTHFYLK